MNPVFSEIIPKNNSNKQKIVTKKFTIELLIHNSIYENRTKKREFTDKERIELDIPITLKENSPNEFSILVEDLTNQLKIKGYPISTSQIFIYNKELLNGYSLLNDKEIIYSSNLSIKDTIKLKLENRVDNKLIDDTSIILKKCFDITETNKTEMTQENSLNNKNKKIKNSESNKRARKIGEIVKIVYAQRKFYNGYYNDEGEKISCNLEDASIKVNEKKKTLDDYLKQLKKAREFGYDFNKNKNESISHLRNFNEKNSQKNKNLNLDTNKNNNYNDIDNDNEDNIINEHENILELDEDNNNI